MRQVAAVWPKGFRVLIFLALALVVFSIPTSAQKNKDKKKDMPTGGSDASLSPVLPKSDSQAVDQTIGEALGYWQIGEVESLHKYYADDVVVVSGAWEPPVIGWDNFVKAYQAQRARVTGVRMDRSNTFIKVNGNSAWGTYQFLYTAMMDNNAVQYRGHTTVLLAKQADRWVITLNHSSVVDSSTLSPSASTEPAQSSKP